MKIAHVESERRNSWPTLDQVGDGRKEREEKKEEEKERFLERETPPSL